MPLSFPPHTWKNRSRAVSGLFRAFTFTLLIAAFGFTQLHAQSVAYETNNTEGSVGVIDTNTNTVVATISGFTHPFCAALSPDAKLLYVCSTNNTVSVVDTQTNTVSATISLAGALGFIGNEGAPQVIVFSPDGTRAFVISSGGGNNSQLFVIDTAANTVVNSASFGRNFLLAIAISPDGNNLYLATEATTLSQSAILVVDANTLATVTAVATGHLLFDMALSADGSTLYGSDESGFIGGSNGVLVVDTASNTVIATVPLPNNTFVTGIAVTPDGQHVYVEDFTLARPTNSTVTVINTADNSVNTTIPGDGLTLTALAITPDGGSVLATNSILGSTVPSTVVVISTATNTITSSITVGHFADVITTPRPQPPTAVAGPNQTVTVDRTVHLDGSGSFAPNTPPANLQYTWSFVSRPAGSAAVLTGANTATPSFVADAIGNFVVQLVVKDPATTLSSVPSQVTISSIWSPPTANPGPAQSAVTGEPVNLNGTGSSDPNGLPLTYAWSFVSTPSGSTATIAPTGTGLASFTPDVPGLYTVQLVVSDPFGSSQPATVTITAITPGDFAQQRIHEAINYIAAMPCSHFDACGHRNALSNFLQQAIDDIQKGKTSQAIGKLNDALIRTDGFPLRGAIDGNGPGMDWIINTADQNFVYAKLTAALNVLQ